MKAWFREGSVGQSIFNPKGYRKHRLKWERTHKHFTGSAGWFVFWLIIFFPVYCFFFYHFILFYNFYIFLQEYNPKLYL